MKKQLLSNVILALCLGLVSNELFAQDECTNAVNLTSNSVNGLTTAGSTYSSSMGPTCSGMLRDVWYKFTASTSTTTTVTVTPTNGGDPVLTIYSACSEANRIQSSPGQACADLNSGGGAESYTNLSVTAGTTYYIRVGEYQESGQPATGTVNFGITLSGTVLPIELTAFNANTEGSKNRLTWATASERGTSHFDIERSRDSKTFEKVGEVKAKGEAANYVFTDSKAVSGTLYYRLKMVDFDGTTDYSKIVSVQSYGKGNVKIYPTVTADNLVVEGAKSVTIVNMMGQVVLQREMNGSVVSLQELPKGIYIVKGEATEGGTFLEKIVKE